MDELINNTRSYYDLNVSENCFRVDDCYKTVKLLYEFGYRTIAVNQTIEDGNLELNKKKKKKGEPRETPDIVPVPFNLNGINEVIVKQGFSGFKVLNRLTVSFSNQEIIHKMTKSPNYKKYDIIAAQPTTMPALMFTCSTLDADVFSVDPESKLNLRLNRKLYRQLADKGYHFELMYGPAIEDTTKRKNLIFLSHLYHSVGKSRNIIFTSGVSNPIHLRSPYDIINLGLIFGLNELQCKAAVSTESRKTLLNSVGRKHGKAIMFVDAIKDESKDKSVILVDESEDEDMDTDQPVQKKPKQ